MPDDSSTPIPAAQSTSASALWPTGGPGGQAQGGPAQPGTMSEQSGIPGVGTNVDPATLFRSWMMAQQQMQPQQFGPSMAHTQAQIQPFQPEKVGGGNTASEALSSFSSGLHNLMGQVGQAMQRRRATEQQHLFDRFTTSWQGVQEASTQRDQAMQELRQASGRDPQAQAAAIAKLRKADEVLTTNKGILDTMFNGPRGERNYKILAKGFGVDDKNANSPERQAATQAFKKATSGAGALGDRAAGLLAQLPQTLQPPPGQQQIKPPTGGQMLNYLGKQQALSAKDRLQQNMIDYYKTRDIDNLNAKSMKDGMRFDPNPKNPNAPPILHIYTPEERKTIPLLDNQDKQNQAKIELENATRESRNDPDNPLVAARVMDAQTRQAKLKYDGEMLELRQQQEAWKEAHYQSAEAKNAGVAATNTERAYETAQAYLGDPKKPITDSDAQAIVGNYMKATLLASGTSPANIDKQLSSMQGFIDSLVSKVTGPTPDRKLLQDMVNTLGTAAKTARQQADAYGVPRPGAAPAAAPGGESAAPAEPAVGTVEGGYRYKGGGASDPKNWEPVQK